MILMKDVKKKYGNFELEVSLEIPDGRISGIVGKNGAGKSTAIRLILGLAKPDEGIVSISGTESSTLTIDDKRNIGAALAETGFSSQLNIKDITHILAKMYTEFEKEYFMKKCRKLGLSDNKSISEFSTGMKAKLRVLTALTHKAKVLILDEPTAGLDVEVRNEILDMLRNYIAQDEERTILITSHISSDLESLCDDIYIIHDGKIVLHEDTDVILEQYGIIKVNEHQYEKLDKEYIIKTIKEDYGYACLTAQKKYYQENYKDAVIENTGIDDLLLMMTGGYR